MSFRGSVAWPVLEFLEEALDETQCESEAQQAQLPADALFMASCDVFLTRDSADAFTLTLKHRGHVSAIRLTAEVDESGAASLIALVD